MIVRVADNPVNAAGYVTATDVADNRSISRGKTLRMLLQEVVVFYSSFNPAPGWNFYTHRGQNFFGTSQQLKVFFGRAFPKVNMERLIADDLGKGGKVYDLTWHSKPPLWKLSLLYDPAIQS